MRPSFHPPDMSGRIAIITGGNAGLGLETAKALAAAGAQVVLACRSMAKGAAALDRIRAVAARADAHVEPLDLGDLASVRAFAERICEPIHLLINNAGVMGLPRSETKDGFERQFGVNHLGHFALTAQLRPKLAPDARVVTISSLYHRPGRIDFDDLQGARSYRPFKAYGQSKLANLLFAVELDRRLKAAGAKILSVAAHPGYAATNLQTAGPIEENSAWKEAGMRVMNAAFAQSAARGAEPTLMAATAPGVTGGALYGPGGLGELRGAPKRVRPAAHALDPKVAQRLWTVSEELTGIPFALAA